MFFFHARASGHSSSILQVNKTLFTYSSPTIRSRMLVVRIRPAAHGEGVMPFVQKDHQPLEHSKQLWYEQCDNNLTIMEITVALCRI